MKQREKENGGIPLSMAVALLGSGVGLGLGLAGLGALWLQRTDMLVRARAADVDKQLDAIRERQQANDEQLAADLTLFRQVLQAYQPTPVPGFMQSDYAAAPPFPPSVIAPATEDAQAAYEVVNRGWSSGNADLPSHSEAAAAAGVVLPEVTPEPDFLLVDFNEPVSAPGPLDELAALPMPANVGPSLSEQVDKLAGNYKKELEDLFGPDA